MSQKITGKDIARRLTNALKELETASDELIRAKQNHEIALSNLKSQVGFSVEMLNEVKP